MHVRQLRYFVMLADCGTYGRAAEKLGITQSALTQSIANLERLLSARLFVRDRFGTILTGSGRLLLERARVIVAEAKALELELSDPHGDARARINVGVGKTIVETFLAEVVDSFVREHPEVVVHLTEGWSPDLYAGLLAGPLDVVVSCPLPDVVPPPDLKQELICHHTEAVIIGRSNPLYSSENISLSDLSSQFWLLPPDGNRRLHHIRHVFEAAQVEPPYRILRSDASSLGKDLIRRGFIAHGMLEVVAAHLRPDEYRVVDIPELTFARPVFLTVRGRTRLQPAAIAFCRELKQIASGSATAEPVAACGHPGGSGAAAQGSRA